MPVMVRKFFEFNFMRLSIILAGVPRMPLFICRWQNGDFSAVSAPSRDEAMELLDEVGNADVADLFTVKNFMVHFQLKTEADAVDEPVPVELEGFGDDTYDILCERVYPVYSKVSAKVVDDLPTSGEIPNAMRECALAKLKEAIVTERLRNMDSKKAKLSDDPDVAELQKERDTPRQIAEKVLKEHRRRAITEMQSPSKKVQ